MIHDRLDPYFDTLDRVTRGSVCTTLDGAVLSLGAAIERVCGFAHAAHDGGNKLMFIGNGGSASIASHFANDFSKNGGLRSMAFSDAAVLTCLSNDYGYEHSYAKQIEWHGIAGDVLVAISSSGRSANILNAVAVARARGCHVVTFSGFDEDNPLRKAGDVSFYVNSRHYGFVEVGHTALIHAILDLDMGWAPGC